MRFKQLVSLMCLCAMVVMSGCAESQFLIQDGPTAITGVKPEIELMRDTLMPEPRHCPISQLLTIRHLKEQKWAWYRADKWFSDEKPDQFFQSCPDKNMPLDGSIKLPTWSAHVVQYQPSVFRTIGPELARTIGYVAGAATLARLWPTTNIVNNNSGVDIKASTAGVVDPRGFPK